MIPWSGKTFNSLYANKISPVQGIVFNMSEQWDDDHKRPCKPRLC